MGSLNTQNMNTLHGTVLRTISPEFIFTLTVMEILETVEIFDLNLPRHATIVRCKLKHTNRNYMTAVMYQATRLTCNFIYGMCFQPTGIIQLVTHINFYFSTCEPAETNNLCHKNDGRPWFTETRATPYQPFVLIHNAQFHSECYRNDKGSKQICENNVIPSTNIQ